MIDESGIEWEKIVERRQSCLFESFINLGSKEEYWQRISMPQFFKNRKLVDFNILYDKEELKNYEDFTLKNFEKDRFYFRKYLEKGYEVCNELTQCALEIQNIKNLKEKNNKELLNLFIDYRDKIATATNFLMPAVRAGKILDNMLKSKISEIVKDSSKAEAYHKVLTSVKEATNDTIELIDFLSLVSKIKKDEELKQLFEKSSEKILEELEKSKIAEEFNNYYEKHKWIGFRAYIDSPWSKEFVIDRIKHMIKEDPDEKLERLKDFNKNNEEDIEKLKHELSLSKDFIDFVDDARKFVHFRTFRTDCMYRSGFLIFNLFEEIAERMNITLQEFLGLTQEEVITFLEKMPSIYQIRERMKEYGSVGLNGNVIILEGKNLEDYKKSQKQEQHSASEIKGVCAFPGKIKGTAKIVRNKTMLNKIQPGDILIAPMTFPDFIPAMEKAAAFVTDEGGILCHAAIVSRELKKPCVIGTKIATKVFKDDESIEIDAEKGIVRKI
jgi:phosphoenolpyruvate synthase/pyruvate phosphate dikinase